MVFISTDLASCSRKRHRLLLSGCQPTDQDRGEVGGLCTDVGTEITQSDPL